MNHTLTSLSFDNTQIDDELELTPLSEYIFHIRINLIYHLDLNLNPDLFRLGNEEGKAITNSLSKNITLTFLTILNNQLGSESEEAFAETLGKNDMLKFLNISNNPLELKGVEEIARALSNNNNLTSLYLLYVQFGSEGGASRRQISNHHFDFTVTLLSVSRNSLGSNRGKLIASALCRNNSLKILKLLHNACRKLMYHSTFWCAIYFFLYSEVLRLSFFFRLWYSSRW